MKTVLVTGGAGFIGFHLSKRLLEEGYTVVGLDNLNDYYDVSLKESRVSMLTPHERYTFVKGDMADADTVNVLFEQYSFDVVVNLGAQAGVRYSLVNPQAYIQSNIVGFFNILEACRHYPVEHLLYASSSSVYGNQEKTPFAVEDPVDKPISLYAATKKSNELMAYSYSHLYGIPTTGLRFFTVYGPYGRPDMAYFSFSVKIMKNEPIQVFNNGDLYRDFTYIDDVVAGVTAMLESPPTADENGDRATVYNIGNNHPEKLGYFIETLEKLLGKEVQKVYMPMQPGDVYQTYADISKLEQDFGFRPSTPLAVGLKRFAAWFKEYYTP